FAILRYFDAVSACGFATWNFCPAFPGVPFPELAVVFSGHHLSARSVGIWPAFQEICRDKATIGKTNDGVQSDWIRRNRTPDPCQSGRLSALIHFEDFDGFPFSVVYCIKCVRVPAGMQG